MVRVWGIRVGMSSMLVMIRSGSDTGGPSGISGSRGCATGITMR